LTELGGSAGLQSNLDVFLCRQLRANVPNDSQKKWEEYENCCLLLVYTAVAIPYLAKEIESKFDPNFGSHANNTHCIAKAINTITSALFNVHKKSASELDREHEISQRMVEFLALASSSLLKLGQESHQSAANRDSIYMLLGEIVSSSKVLSMDRLESCFPYVLLRNSYAEIQEKSRLRR
jgi:NCK-associated protein 1